jgi:hypothetical protein
MATASVTYAIANGNAQDGDEVGTNFTDLVSFLNTHVVHKDGSVTMTGALSLPSSDPSTDNHAARKVYVDRKVPTIVPVTIDADASVASGDTIGSATITDPGYDIEIWGWATIHAAASSSASIWSLDLYVDGNRRSSLVVPFVSVSAPFGQSIGVPLRRTAHTTGTNASFTVKVSRIDGSGTLTIGFPAATNEVFNGAEVQWRKNG